MKDDWLGAPPAEGAPAYHGATFADEERFGGHPVIATLIAAVLVLFVAAGAQTGLPGTPAEAIGKLVGSAIMGAIAWGIAYAITIKHASTVWKIVSLIILLVVGSLGGLISLGVAGASFKEDLRVSSNEMERVLASDDLSARMKVEGGPLARMIATATNGTMADAGRFERALLDSGAPALMAMDGLTRSSPIFRNCDRLAALEPLAKELGANRARHLAAARQIAQRAIDAGEMPRATLTEFENGARNSKAQYDRQWALNAEFGAEAAGLCRLLADRSWQLSAGQVTFNSNADAAAFNARIERINRIAQEQERLMAQGQAEARRGVEEMRRIAR